MSVDPAVQDSPTVRLCGATYVPLLMACRAWSRAFLAAARVAKPPTQRGLVLPVRESSSRTTYDQVLPRWRSPSRILESFNVSPMILEELLKLSE